MGAYNLGQITAALKLETRQFTAELDDVTRRFDRFLEVGYKVGEGLAKSFGGWLKLGIETNSMLDANTRSFTRLAGSEEAAVKFMQELQSFAVATPFDMEGIADTTKGMQAMGVELENTIPLIQVLGDQAALAGTGSDGVKRLANAFTQVMAAGKLGGQELLQFINNGVAAVPILTRAYDKSSGEIRKMMEAGALDSKTVLSALLEGMVATSEGQMAQMSQTFGGRWTSIMENMKIASANATKPLYDQLTALLPVAAAFASALMRGMGTLIPAVMAVVNITGILMVGFLSLSDSTQNWIIGLTAVAALATFIGIVFASMIFTIAASLAAVLTFFTFIGTTGAAVLAIVTSMGISFLALATMIGTAAVAAFGVWHSEFFNKLGDDLLQIGSSFLDFLALMTDGALKSFPTIVSIVKISVETIYNMWLELRDMSKNVFDAMLKAATGFASGAAKAISAFITTGMSGLLSLLKGARELNKINPFATDESMAVLDKAIDTYSDLVDLGKEASTAAAKGITDLAQGINDLNANGSAKDVNGMIDQVNQVATTGVAASMNAIADTYMDAIKQYVPADFQAKAQNIINDFIASTKLAPVDVDALIASLFKDFKISPKQTKGGFTGFDKELDQMIHAVDLGLVSQQEKINALFAADNISGAVDWTIWFNNFQMELDKAAPLATQAFDNLGSMLKTQFDDIAAELEKSYGALKKFNDDMLGQLGFSDHIDFAKNFQSASASGNGIPGAIGSGVDSAMGAGSMAGPIGIVIGAIISLITKTEAWASILGTATHAIDGVVSWLDALLQAVGPFTNTMNTITDSIINMIMPLFDALGSAFNGLGATLQPLVFIFNAFAAIFRSFGAAFEMIATVLDGVFFVVFNVLKGVALAVMGFQLAITYFWNALVMAVAAIVDLIPGLGKLADKIRTAQAGTQNLQDQIDELMALSYTDAQAMAENAVAVDTATTAMESMTEQLLNVPEGYKVALARFTATTPEQLVQPTDSNTGGNSNGNDSNNGDDKNYNEDNHTVTTPKDKNGDTNHSGATSRSASPGSANKSSDNSTLNGSGSGGSSARNRPGFAGSPTNQTGTQTLGKDRPGFAGSPTNQTGTQTLGREASSGVYIENLYVTTENYDDFLEQLNKVAERKAYREKGVPGTFASNKFRKR